MVVPSDYTQSYLVAFCVEALLSIFTAEVSVGLWCQVKAKIIIKNRCTHDGEQIVSTQSVRHHEHCGHTHKITI